MTQQTESTQKNWANPTPAGLTALAMACYCFFALLTGKVTPNALMLLGIWLLGGFIVQLAVGLIDLKNQNISGGNAFLYFCAFFMFVSGASFIVKHVCMVHNVPLDARIDGWAWLALTLATYIFTPAFLKAPKALFFVLLFLDIALPFITLRDMQVLTQSWSAIIPAYSLLCSGTIAIYLAGALMMNSVFGKTVLPVGKPFIS